MARTRLKEPMKPDCGSFPSLSLPLFDMLDQKKRNNVKRAGAKQVPVFRVFFTPLWGEAGCCCRSSIDSKKFEEERKPGRKLSWIRLSFQTNCCAESVVGPQRAQRGRSSISVAISQLANSKYRVHTASSLCMVRYVRWRKAFRRNHFELVWLQIMTK